MIPPDYFELGVALDIASFAVTFLAASMGFRLYRLFRKPRYLQFSAGFFLISVSYLFFGLINFLSFAEEARLPVFLMNGVLEQYLDVFFMLRSVMLLLGLLLLIYLYYDIIEWPLQLLIGALILFTFLLAGANDFVFFILSALLFFFIVLKLVSYYRKKPERGGLLALLGFTFLFVAKVLSGIVFLSDTVFFVAYFFKLVGVVMILLSLWVISR